MKVIKPSVEIIEEMNILKKIELAGRVCYKSEGLIGEGSAEKFIKNIIKRGHESVIEHGSYIFEVDKPFFKFMLSKLRHLHLKGYNLFIRCTNDIRPIISGNVRAWRDFFKACIKEDGKLPYFLILGTVDKRKDKEVLFGEFYENHNFNGFCTFREITKYDLKTINEKLTHWDETARFICDRGVTHEIIRHRPASYSQESTRYCNYSKDDFGNEITVIEPCYLEPGTEGYNFWYNACSSAEDSYFSMLDWGCTSQEARAVLPNSLKTEIIMTANLTEWNHFFKLRTSAAAHPQMREVANMLLDKMINKCLGVF